jgi:hypothetical protein
MSVADYDAWFAELAVLAKERGLEWMVQKGAETHRDAFLKGASPEEELRTLADMSEWRGCGCGGA